MQEHWKSYSANSAGFGDLFARYCPALSSIPSLTERAREDLGEIGEEQRVVTGATQSGGWGASNVVVVVQEHLAVLPARFRCASFVSYFDVSEPWQQTPRTNTKRSSKSPGDTCVAQTQKKRP